MSAAQTHRVMADLTVQNALTVAANAEVAMAAAVAGAVRNAANVVSVVSAQKDGLRVAAKIVVRDGLKVARKADQTVAAQNEVSVASEESAVNAHPTRGVQSSAANNAVSNVLTCAVNRKMNRELKAKNSVTHAPRVNLASPGTAAAKSARAVSGVNAMTATSAAMSSARR